MMRERLPQAMPVVLAKARTTGMARLGRYSDTVPSRRA
jgi:hypothetical protein